MHWTMQGWDDQSAARPREWWRLEGGAAAPFTFTEAMRATEKLHIHGHRWMAAQVRKQVSGLHHPSCREPHVPNGPHAEALVLTDSAAAGMIVCFHCLSRVGVATGLSRGWYGWILQLDD